MKKTVRELADLVGGKIIGSPDTVIVDVKSAEKASSEDITFATGIYAEHLDQIQAGAVLVEEDLSCGQGTLIVVPDARRAFGQIVSLFHPPVKISAGVHATAVIGKNVKMGQDVSVMAYAVVEDDAVIGDRTVIYPHTYIGRGVRIGEDSEIYPGAVIHDHCILGSRVVLRSHAVIGGQGFGFSTDEKGHHTHIEQIGNVVLEDDVEIGAGSAVDNGTMDSTLVRRGTKIDNLVHLGHNVEVGEDCFLIAQTGVAGSTKIGNQCILAGQTGVTGHISIADHVVLGGKSGVVGNIKEPGVYVGYPARPRGEWGRMEVLMGRLPELLKKIRKLEKQIGDFPVKHPPSE